MLNEGDVDGCPGEQASTEGGQCLKEHLTGSR